MVKDVQIVIGCSEGGIEQLEEGISDLFIQKERFNIVNKMQKVFLCRNESVI